MNDDLDELRKQMRFPTGHTNLNAGSLSPVPESTYLKTEAVRRELAYDAHRFFFASEAKRVEASRLALADFLRCDAENLLLLPNVTWAINVAFRSLAGGCAGRAKVLTSDLDYGSLRHLLAYLRRGVRDDDELAFDVVEMKFSDCRSHAAIIERFREALAAHPDAHAAFLPHVVPATAWELPVKALCTLARAAGVTSIVDGAHAPGAIDVDVSAIGADVYGGNCHKWMMAPAGVGFLHASPSFAPLLRPLVCAWGEKNRVFLAEHPNAPVASSGLTFHRDAIENHGAIDRVSQAVLPDAIAFLAKLRAAGARAHVLELKAYLLAQFAALRAELALGDLLEPVLLEGSDPLVPMTSFAFPPCRRKDFVTWMLEHHDIALVAARLREDRESPDHTPDPSVPYFVRVCTAWFNTRADVDKLIVALREVLVRRPSELFELGTKAPK